MLFNGNTGSIDLNKNKSLGYITEFIPIGNPIKFREEEFLKYNDFGNLLICITNFNNHLLNYDDVFNLLLETFKNNEEVVKNTLFFQAFEKISEYINNKRGLLQIFLKSKNIRVFDIINDKEWQPTDCEKLCVELLSISPIKTIDYFLRVNPEKTPEIIQNIFDELKVKSEKHLHVFLHHLHQKDKLLSLKYNYIQPGLYLKYNKELLLDFLKSTDEYSEDDVLELCIQNQMLKETVFILEKKGNKTTQILDIFINQMGDYEQAVKFVVTKHFYNKELWDTIVTEAQRNFEFLKVLIKFTEYYSDQELIIKSIPDGSCIGDIIEAFQQIRIQISILNNAELLSRSNIELLLDTQLKQNLSGCKVDINACNYCNEPLVNREILYEIYQTQPQHSSSRKRNDLKDMLRETRMLSILKFPECGHTLHLKCLPSHKNCLSNEEDIDFLNSLI